MRLEHVLQFDHQLNPECPLRLSYVKIEGAEGCSKLIDVHDAAHLGILFSGEISYWINGNQGKITDGQVWLIAPLEPHGTVGRSADYELLLVSFLWEEVERFLGSKLSYRNKLLFSAANQRIQSLNRNISGKVITLGRQLAKLYDQTGEYNRLRQWILFLEILVEVFQHAQIDNTCDKFMNYERIKPALNLITSSCTGGYVSLDSAAAACGLSSSRFNHLFKQYYNISFGKFEMRYRLNAAAAAIAQGNLTLSDIASKWNFTDSSHFSRCFKKAYGSPPGTFQKRLALLK